MTLSIRLPLDVEERLKKLALLTGRTKSYYITEAICTHLEELEGRYLVEQRLIEASAGNRRKVGRK